MPQPSRTPAVRTRRRAARKGPARLLAAGAVSVAVGLAAAALVGSTGCAPTMEAPKAAKLPVITPMTGQPEFMKGTVLDYAVTVQLDTMPVSNYGLVSQLRGTGSCDTSNTVRGYMWKEMVRRGFDKKTLGEFGKLTPADVFGDPSFAIVRVDAFIPPGAREGDWIDARVMALPDPNRTTSLVHGMLFETDLKEAGADRPNPAGAVAVHAVVKGPIMVNPVYAMDAPPAPERIAEGTLTQAERRAQESLRSGTVLFSAVVKHDRPIMLQVREPNGMTARRIQNVVNERFQSIGSESKLTADAKTENIVELLVPKAYRGNYQHFVKVVEHLYLQTDPGFRVTKARQLAEEAAKPDAPLDDIAYAWEGIGPLALESVRPMLNHKDPSVAYFAARAAAFIGDPSQAAENRLMQIASSPSHPYRLAAVKTLGELPPSASLNALLRRLLDSDLTLIRTEAYQILARPRERGGDPDSSIVRTYIRPPGDAAANREFILDLVPGNGPPLVYAVRNGVPRVAVIGRTPAFSVQGPLTTMDDRLTVAAQENGRSVLLYFRDYKRDAPVKTLALSRLDRLIEALGGLRGEDPKESLNFTYGEVVAILQKMVDAQKLVARGPKGEELLASLVIREPDRIEADLTGAPLIDVPPDPNGLRPPPSVLGPPRANGAGDGLAPGGGGLAPPPGALGPPTAVRPSVGAEASAVGASTAPRFGAATPVAPAGAATANPRTPGGPTTGGSNAPAFGSAPAFGTNAGTPVARPTEAEGSNAPRF